MAADDRILVTLRQQAWARAKAELEAVLATYWDAGEGFDVVQKKIKDFVNDLDDCELG